MPGFGYDSHERCIRIFGLALVLGASAALRWMRYHFDVAWKAIRLVIEILVLLVHH
jgi:hypothetical protein